MAMASATLPAPWPERPTLHRPRNHDQDGQNVIFGDSQLPFPNPFTGTQYDNVFTGRYGPSTTAPATTAGYDASDSVLLPQAN